MCYTTKTYGHCHKLVAEKPWFCATDFADGYRKNYLCYQHKICMMVIFCMLSISSENCIVVALMWTEKSPFTF